MTQLRETVATSLTNIRSINENIARLKEEGKTARKEAIQPFLEALAASGEVSLVAIYGYTPGFNDGEPCEHSADFHVNVKAAKSEDLFDRGIGLEDEIPSDLIEGLRDETNWVGRQLVTDPDALAHNVALCEEHGHVYEPPSADTLKAISEVVFATAEEEHSTNYYVTYLLKDGKFEVHEGEYDCGY